MKNSAIFIIVFLLIVPQINPQQRFHINLNDREDDLFKVTFYPDNISSSNNVFNFAATAPGTYQVMNIGRYVRSFKAFDESNNEVPVEQISVNKWSISSPEKVKYIKYEIAETWDTPVDSLHIWRMAGTSLEEDHAVINGQAVFGYLKGKQFEPIEVKIDHPENWNTGTALEISNDGYYSAENFNHIVDSPILLGELSRISTIIDSTVIDIYTYSETDKIKAEDILDFIDDILEAARLFMEDLPVERYTFLYHFEDEDAGAWEHHYSSFYAYKEKPLEQLNISSLEETAAHEFFHIITPLNIHSELVSEFDFENPTLSQHLWLYEGVTEWASNMLIFRAGMISLEEHLQQIKEQLHISQFFDPEISLRDLALQSYEKQAQYVNIYFKGAVTAELLDIRILELSGGKKGLREILIELSGKYGPEKPFDEENFFIEFVEITYPEIQNFIDDFIINSEGLPIKEYFNKIGINYWKEKGVDSSGVELGFEAGIGENKTFIILNVNNPSSGLKKGDILHKISGTELTFENYKELIGKIQRMKAGERIMITVLRNDIEKEFELTAEYKKLKHIFKVEENPTEQQLKLREAWMKNL